jgi:hypothetical protein
MKLVLLASRAAIAASAVAPLAVGGLLAWASSEPVFVAWGAGTGVVLATVLGMGLGRGWNGWAIAGRLGLLGAVATLVLGRLLAKHGEAADWGLEQIFDAAYSPAWIGPRLIQFTAIVLGVGGALAILISHGSERLARIKRAGGPRATPGEPRGTGR